MIKLLHTEFIKTNQKNKESLIYEGYILNCETKKEHGRKVLKCKLFKHF